MQRTVEHLTNPVDMYHPRHSALLLNYFLTLWTETKQFLLFLPIVLVVIKNHNQYMKLLNSHKVNSILPHVEGYSVLFLF